MKIEIVVDPARPAPPQSLVSRVAPPPAAVVATTTTTRVARFVFIPLLIDHFAYPVTQACLAWYPQGKGSRQESQRPSTEECRRP